jgi:hypothetical protein
MATKEMKIKGNENQNHVKILPYYCWLPSRTKTSKNVGKKMEKKEPSRVVGGNEIDTTTVENSMAVLQKTKSRPAI